MYEYSCGATPLCGAFVWEMEKEVTWDGIEKKVCGVQQGLQQFLHWRWKC